MPARAEVIAGLRASIDRIERRVGLDDRQGLDGQGPDRTAAEGVPQVGAGSLSEIFSDGTRDAGAALGFALMQARGLLSRERPAVIFLQMRAEAQETGLPYGPGLMQFGFHPDALAMVRTDTITELMWAMEEAAGCRTVAAVIADVARHHEKLDFTASRRLSMRAESFGTALMVLRTGMEREASAAGFRFHVAVRQSAGQAFDTRAPGVMHARLTLEKGARLLPKTGAARRQDAFGRDFWDVRWSEDGLVADISGSEARSGTGSKPALSGADPAGLGDRLSQTA